MLKGDKILKVDGKVLQGDFRTRKAQLDSAITNRNTNDPILLVVLRNGVETNLVGEYERQHDL